MHATKFKKKMVSYTKLQLSIIYFLNRSFSTGTMSLHNGLTHNSSARRVQLISELSPERNLKYITL